MKRQFIFCSKSLRLEILKLHGHHSTTTLGHPKNNKRNNNNIDEQ